MRRAVFAILGTANWQRTPGQAPITFHLPLSTAPRTETIRLTTENGDPAGFLHHGSLARPEVVERQVSRDGTRKWLLRLAPDAQGARHEVEAVYIPEQDRGTLCISSQIGCALDCAFCATSFPIAIEAA